VRHSVHNGSHSFRRLADLRLRGYLPGETAAFFAGALFAAAGLLASSFQRLSACSQRQNLQLHYGSAGSSSCTGCARGTSQSGFQKAQEPQLFEVKFSFYAMQNRIVDAPCFLEL
jgi:hypothetical protein